jgi:hypothetical protein
MDVDNLILDIVELILVDLEGRTFTFKLEDDQTTIVAYKDTDGRRGRGVLTYCRVDIIIILPAAKRFNSG